MRYLVLFLFYHTWVVGQSPHQWVRTNPGGGGAFSTIEAGPTGQIIAGSDLSGAYYSWDFGQTWDVYGQERGLEVTHVSGLGFHPTEEDTFFIGTEAGIYKSADGGGFLYEVLDHGYITDIAVAPSDTRTIYATYHATYNASGGSIYKSIDGGEHFSQVSIDLPAGHRLLELHVSPTDHNFVLVLSGKGRFHCGPASLFKSINGGVNWTQKATGLGAIMDLAMHPSSEDTLYLSTMTVDCSTELYYTSLDGDLHRSVDGGENWNLRTSDRPGIIWIKRDAPNIIRMIDPREPWPWIPTGGTWRSTNAGLSWTQTASGNWDGGYQSSLAWAYGSSYNGFCKTLGESLENPDVLLWTNAQWVFGTSDEGVSFDNMHTNEVTPGWWQSRGFDNVVMNEIAVSPTDPNVLYVAFADLGLWRSIDRGTSWQSANVDTYTGNWEGFGGNSLTVMVDPHRSNVVWSGMQGDFTEPAYLVKSVQHGLSSSWSSATGLGTPTRISGLSVDPQSNVSNRTLFVTADGHVYRSTDDGATWSSSLINGGLHFTAVDHLNGQTVYAGGRSGIYRSTNGGANWTDVGLPAMQGQEVVDFFDFDYEGVTDISTDPIQTGWVYVTVKGDQGGLYRSKNSGTQWENLYSNVYMRAVAINPSNNQQIYLGSSSAYYAGGYNSQSLGVLYSENQGLNWSAANGEMAWPFANSMAIDQSVPPRIYLGSPGTGVQYAYVGGSVCQQNLTISAPTINGTYQAGETLTTMGNIEVQNHALFKANHAVELNQGFTVPEAAQLDITMEGCE